MDAKITKKNRSSKEKSKILKTSNCFCCWLVVCLLFFSSSFFFFFDNLTACESDRAQCENECDAQEKNTQPLVLVVTLRLLFSYACLTMSTIEGNKQANIHAIFAIFLTSFLPLPLPLQATFFVTLAVFTKLALVRGAASLFSHFAFLFLS